MLDQNQLLTICAALQFWEEEMCPHGETELSGYFPPGNVVVLPAAQVRQMRERLMNCNLRHGVPQPAKSPTSVLLHAEFQTSHRDESQASQSVAVLIPKPTATGVKDPS